MSSNSVALVAGMKKANDHPKPTKVECYLILFSNSVLLNESYK